MKHTFLMPLPGVYFSFMFTEEFLKQNIEINHSLYFV